MPLLWLLLPVAAAAAYFSLVPRAGARGYESTAFFPVGDDAIPDASTIFFPTASTAAAIMGDIGAAIKKIFTPPAAAAPYVDAIATAEYRYGLPESLLARVLQQESHYRQDIISGKTKSATGAVGIAQFMPGTARDLGIDPTDPMQSIDGAGRYLAQLYKRFGDWAQAIAAYNWGQGNQGKDLRDGIVGNEWPAETRRYVTEILSDVSA